MRITMKTISKEEFFKAFDEIDGYYQYEDAIVGSEHSDTQYRMVYGDPQHRMWIVYYWINYEEGLTGEQFTAHEAESIEVCIEKYRIKEGI
jgi:hypothetical protein